MKKILLLTSVLGLSVNCQATSTDWKQQSGFWSSLNSDLRIYTTSSEKANLGETAFTQVGMEFQNGSYIVTCARFIYQGVLNDSIVIEKVSSRTPSNKDAVLTTITDAVIKNEATGFVPLGAYCAITGGAAHTFYVPKSWASAPVDLNGLVVKVSVNSDGTLNSAVTKP